MHEQRQKIKENEKETQYGRSYMYLHLLTYSDAVFITTLVAQHNAGNIKRHVYVHMKLKNLVEYTFA